MSKILSTVLVLGLCFTAFSGSAFNSGWKAGYKAGYCGNKIGCIAPVTPIAPVPPIGKNDWKGGYYLGFLRGLADSN